MSTLQIALLLAYLYINILDLGHSNSASFLLLIFLLSNSAIQFSRALREPHKIYFDSTFFILAVFLAYMAMRVSIDTGDVNQVKRYYFESTSGIILFLSAGWFVNLNIRRIFVKAKIKKSQGSTFYILLFNLTFQVYLFLYFWSQKRDDYFLIVDNTASYQRTGNFLIIAAILTTYIFLRNCAQNITYPKSTKSFSLLINGLYYSAAIIAIISGQLLGSNKSFIILVALTIIALQANLQNFFRKETQPNDNDHNKKIFKVLPFSNSLYRFGGLLLVLIVSTYIIMLIFGVDPMELRIFGMGQGDFNFISSRINLIIQNFQVQFSISPFVGNFIADQTTYGEGTYIHSLPLYLLVHTGIIGFLLFFCFIFTGLLRLLQNILSKNDEKLDSSKMAVSILLIVIFLSVAATSVHWSVLWFTIGLFLPMVTIYQTEKCQST